MDALDTLQSCSDTAADSIINRAMESTLTAKDVMTIMASVLAGKVSGADTVVFKGLDGTSDRVIAEVVRGNRTAIVVDGT